MCAAAHGWVGLGRIVYAASSRQLVTWVAELGMPPSPVRTLAIEDVVPGLTVHGPVGTADGPYRQTTWGFTLLGEHVRSP